MSKTEYKTLELETASGVATVWLNRPQVHNAFNNTMLDELAAVLETLAGDPSLRVVVFSGRGKSFSAGADLNWMKAMVDYDYEQNLADALKISKVFYRIYTLDKPVIAAINGATIGGGMGFVGAADIVIAAENATFSLSEVRIGVVPACISPYLFKKVGEGVLKELFISGRRFDAREAFQMHLINGVFPGPSLMTEALDRARELLKCGPKAIAMCKELFVKVPEMSLREAYDYTARVIARMRVSDEAQEGMKSFLGKKPPAWRPENE